MRNLAGRTLVFFKLRKGIDRASISTTSRQHWLSTLATATVSSSSRDKLLASAIVSISAVPKPAFRSITGTVTIAKAGSTQTLVYRGSRSGGGDRCSLHRCCVRLCFASGLTLQTDYTGNARIKPTHDGVNPGACLKGDISINKECTTCPGDTRQ